MRKQILDSQPQDSSDDSNWIVLEHLAQVEVTSEEENHPIESALIAGRAGGWRASQAGVQVIRLRFDEPVNIGLIQLLFIEKQTPRTQEFVLRWSNRQPDADQEVLRQQFTFSPPGTTRQLEQYTVQLRSVLSLELILTPDINDGPARASLQELRLA
ncbi:hypothetical protein ACFQ4C_21655 [Larkinella insperata]|uniref:Carbohydrate-binding protein n=1 Tax=Larkinella insperata TaxID=332158 RepID=A0ABW3QBQ1_9BACT